MGYKKGLQNFGRKNLQETCLGYITVNGRVTLKRTLQESARYHQVQDMHCCKALMNTKIYF